MAGLDVVSLKVGLTEEVRRVNGNIGAVLSNRESLLASYDAETPPPERLVASVKILKEIQRQQRQLKGRRPVPSIPMW